MSFVMGGVVIVGLVLLLWIKTSTPSPVNGIPTHNLEYYDSKELETPNEQTNDEFLDLGQKQALNYPNYKDREEEIIPLQSRHAEIKKKQRKSATEDHHTHGGKKENSETMKDSSNKTTSQKKKDKVFEFQGDDCTKGDGKSRKCSFSSLKPCKSNADCTAPYVCMDRPGKRKFCAKKHTTMTFRDREESKGTENNDEQESETTGYKEQNETDQEEKTTDEEQGNQKTKQESQATNTKDSSSSTDTEQEQEDTGKDQEEDQQVTKSSLSETGELDEANRQDLPAVKISTRTFGQLNETGQRQLANEKQQGTTEGSMNKTEQEDTNEGNQEGKEVTQSHTIDTEEETLKDSSHQVTKSPSNQERDDLTPVPEPEQRPTTQMPKEQVSKPESDAPLQTSRPAVLSTKSTKAPETTTEATLSKETMPANMLNESKAPTTNDNLVMNNETRLGNDSGSLEVEYTTLYHPCIRDRMSMCPHKGLKHCKTDKDCSQGYICGLYITHEGKEMACARQTNKDGGSFQNTASDQNNMFSSLPNSDLNMLTLTTLSTPTTVGAFGNNLQSSPNMLASSISPQSHLRAFADSLSQSNNSDCKCPSIEMALKEIYKQEQMDVSRAFSMLKKAVGNSNRESDNTESFLETETEPDFTQPLDHPGQEPEPEPREEDFQQGMGEDEVEESQDQIHAEHYTTSQGDNFRSDGKEANNNNDANSRIKQYYTPLRSKITANSKSHYKENRFELRNHHRSIGANRMLQADTPPTTDSQIPRRRLYVGDYHDLRK